MKPFGGRFSLLFVTVVNVAFGDTVATGPHGDWLSVTVDATGKTYRFNFDNLNGFLGPSSNPSSQSPLVNEDQTLYALTCQPETRSGVVHLFFKNRDSEIIEIPDLHSKFRKLFPEQSSHILDFVRVEQIRGRTVSLTSYYGFEQSRTPQLREFNFSVDVSPDGAISRSMDKTHVGSIRPADAETEDDFLPVTLGVWPLKSSASSARVNGLIEVEETRTGEGGTIRTVTTIKRKGHMLRSDTTLTMSGREPSAAGQIRDRRTGDSIFLLHDRKTFQIRTAKTKREERELRKRAEPDTWLNEQPKPHSTGRKALIQGHEVEEFVCKTRKANYRWWVSRELARFAPTVNTYDPIYASQYPDKTLLPGVALLTLEEQIFRGPTGALSQITRLTTKLVSISEGLISDSEFQIPRGYREGQ